MKKNCQRGLSFFSKSPPMNRLCLKGLRWYIHFIYLPKVQLFSLFISCTDKITDSGKGNTIFPITPVYFGNPAWHPTSNWIAALHSDSFDINNDRINESSFSGIWLINAMTGQKKPFLNYQPSSFSWSKDGHKLAMVMGGQIYSINIPSIEPIEVDSASFVQLTYESGYFPSFSADGEWIVYDSRQDSPGPNLIWKMRSDGSDKQCISIKGTGEWRMPDWSPNKNKIVYQRYVGVGGSEIFIMDSSGASQFRLTNALMHDQYPKYSKSGELIGFLSHPLKGPSKIRLINSDGTSLRSVSPDWALEFDFSPNDSKIAFVLWVPNTSTTGNGQLWIMNIDGSGVTQLTYKP
jgi:Tol biopolymer transport system component